MIVCRTRKDVELAFEHLKIIMIKLKLTLNPQKTKILDVERESFDFFGFCYQKFGKTKRGRKLPYMMPSRKAMKKVKDAMRVITCRKSAYEGLEQKVEKFKSAHKRMEKLTFSTGTQQNSLNSLMNTCG